MSCGGIPLDRGVRGVGVPVAFNDRGRLPLNVELIHNGRSRPEHTEGPHLLQAVAEWYGSTGERKDGMKPSLR
jgi:hypothetical protein